MKRVNLVLIPEEELSSLKQTQEAILQKLENLHSCRKPAEKNQGGFVTAKEFMAAVRICRSKFDQLVASNQIKTVKKKRKIYVAESEIGRYFSDSSIQ